MYGIRAVCCNPGCKTAFPVEFTETGPLEGKTPETAYELIENLRAPRSTTNQLMIIMGKGAGLDDKAQIPKFIECPKCNSVFRRSDLTFFVYNASATQKPD